MSISRRRFLRLGAGALGTALAGGGFSLAHSGEDRIAAVPSGSEIINHVRTTSRKVSLTFDDMWTESLALEIGREFQRRGIGLTFFPVGYAVDRNNSRPNPGYANLYARLRDMGHEFGTHLFTHRDITDMTLDQLAAEEMEPALQALRKALGSGLRPVGLRPPYGKVTQAVKDLAERYGMPLILWGLDSQDAICTQRNCKKACEAQALGSPEVYMRVWREHSRDGLCAEASCAESCVPHIMNNYETYMRPGTIILHHGIKASVLAIPRIIRFLDDWNLQAVPLSQLLTLRSL